MALRATEQGRRARAGLVRLVRMRVWPRPVATAPVGAPAPQRGSAKPLRNLRNLWLWKVVRRWAWWTLAERAAAHESRLLVVEINRRVSLASERQQWSLNRPEPFRSSPGVQGTLERARERRRSSLAEPPDPLAGSALEGAHNKRRRRSVRAIEQGVDDQQVADINRAAALGLASQALPAATPPPPPGAPLPPGEPPAPLLALHFEPRKGRGARRFSYSELAVRPAGDAPPLRDTLEA